jgi:hypothetical protein
MAAPATEAPNLGTNPASRSQYLLAAAICAVFLLATIVALPHASAPIRPMPGFIASYQTALIFSYVLTARIFFGQFRRTGSIPVLSFATGAFYTAAIALAQLLSFPNIFANEPIIGSGPDTTIWLWVFWHLGPSLFALAPAWFARDGLNPAIRPENAWRVGKLIALLSVLVVVLITYVVC